MSNRSFCCFQKTDKKSDHSFALSKSATKRAIALSKRAKEQKLMKMSDPSFSK